MLHRITWDVWAAGVVFTSCMLGALARAEPATTRADSSGDAAARLAPDSRWPPRPTTAIYILGRDGRRSRYDAAARPGGAAERSGADRETVRTPAGTTVEARDEWTTGGGAEASVTLTRTLTVVGNGDRAFRSEAEFEVAGARTLAEVDVFVPGLWYATADQTPPSGLIHDVGQRDFVLREDRMALPLVSVRDRDSGTTLTLEHARPDGATVVADAGVGPVIDRRLRFGALGLRRDERGLRLVFGFPGSEGEQTSVGGYKPDRRTAERWHPLEVGATQRYSLTLRRSDAATFARQVRDAWRHAFADAGPRVVRLDAQAVLDASVDVLSHYYQSRGDVAGFPFGVRLPGGGVSDTSMQMGFVGQQLPCAAYLIDEGIRRGRPELRERGRRVVDFWARESFSPAGVPRTWFDLDPEPRFREYDTFLRVVADGTGGMLRAWQVERAAGVEQPRWLAFCRRVGDWLLSAQNADGSFFRSYGPAGGVTSRSTTSTMHPVRLLVDLACATGDARYRDAALRAAAYALRPDAAGRVRYVGGTPDNPDVVDKEAGWIAFDSCLALYDVTRERRWLDAAVDAATFTETWVYAWDVPLPADADPAGLGVPRVRTFTGSNLIATGHSGADQFLAFASLSYARLALYTGDAHFAEVARLLQHNSAQFVDVDGSLGYGRPGLSVEAFSLAVERGRSVRLWLPCCTSAIAEPMARMREAFGVIDVDALLSMDPARREALHDRFARTRGFGP